MIQHSFCFVDFVVMGNILTTFIAKASRFATALLIAFGRPEEAGWCVYGSGWQSL